jgi:gluconokinase
MMRIIVMGVSGTGKSTIGAALAGELRLPFIDGDDLHPPANKQKMASGVALNDGDREPWLDEIAKRLTMGPVVVACSALRQAYRNRLRRDCPDLKLVYLSGSRQVLSERLQRRQHAFMPISLLDSQLMTLEPPTADEAPISVDVAHSSDTIVRLVRESLESSAASH